MKVTEACTMHHAARRRENGRWSGSGKGHGGKAEESWAVPSNDFSGREKLV
jgi:hypothetical protein